MSKKFQLHIPTPCHENWDKMTPVEKGRFCGSCQKQVVDFTNMSDREVAMFFKKPILSQSKDGSVCGRFMQDQLGRDIEIPKKRIPWVKYFFQFALPAFLVSSKATAQGKVRVKENMEISEKQSCTPIKEQKLPMIMKDMIGDTIIINTNKEVIEVIAGMVGTVIEKPVKRSINIIGLVVDSVTGYPVPNATIKIANSERAAIADSSGRFNFKAKLKSEKIQIEISSIGYETKIVEYTTSNGELIINLRQETGMLGEVVIVSPMGIVKGKTTMGYSVVVKQTIFERITKRLSPFKDLIKLYPNPVKSGSTLTIEWRENKADNYKLELFNLTGQLIFSKEMWIDEEARLLNIQIPQVAAGNYFLRMTNKTSGKNYSEKLVIQ